MSQEATGIIRDTRRGRKRQAKCKCKKDSLKECKDRAHSQGRKGMAAITRRRPIRHQRLPLVLDCSKILRLCYFRQFDESGSAGTAGIDSESVRSLFSLSFFLSDKKSEASLPTAREMDLPLDRENVVLVGVCASDADERLSSDL